MAAWRLPQFVVHCRQLHQSVAKRIRRQKLPTPRKNKPKAMRSPRGGPKRVVAPTQVVGLDSLAPQAAVNEDQFRDLFPTDDHYLWALSQAVTPTAAEQRQRDTVHLRVHRLAQRLFGANTKVTVFGSSNSLFYSVSSDMDMNMVVDPSFIKNKKKSAKSPVKLLHKFKGGLNWQHWAKDPCVIPARVPVLQFTEAHHNIKVDLSASNRNAAINTLLLRTYASIDPRARALGLLVKMWAKQNDVANPPAGTLSSYSYILMVISFLQRRPTPILPNLQCPNLMQRYEAQGGSVEPMDGENGLVARFITDASWAQEATVLEHGLNDESLSQLFQRFFAFYCTNRTFLVNLREPDTRDVPVPPTCSIIDPLEVDRDLGGNMNKANYNRLMWLLDATLEDLGVRPIHEIVTWNRDLMQQ